MSQEWGTLLPNGKVCAWDNEYQARRAHVTIPAHPVMVRTVGEWHLASEPNDAEALLSDALGYLWTNAPARRAEIEATCQRLGINATVDFDEASGVVS